MSELSLALSAALGGQRKTVFGAVRIALPGSTIRLVDGSAQLTIGGETYTGRDAAWGVLDTVKGLEDGADDKAPLVTIGFIPADTAAMAAMLDPAVQGSAVTVMIGALDPATGTVIDTYALASLEADVATVTWGDRDRRVELRCTGTDERLFNTEEGNRLSDTSHQLFWPGEQGLAFVTGVDSAVPWGQALNATPDAIRTDGGGAGFGGGGYSGADLRGYGGLYL